MRRHINDTSLSGEKTHLLLDRRASETEPKRPPHGPDTAVPSVHEDREQVFLRRLFSDHDTRKRGSLNINEITAAMRAAGYPVNERQVIGLLDEMPENQISHSADAPESSSGILDGIRRSIFRGTSRRKSKWRKSEIDFKAFRRLVTLWSRASMFLAVEHEDSPLLSGSTAGLGSPFLRGGSDALATHVTTSLATKHMLPDSGFGFAWQCLCLLVATYFVIMSTSLHLFDMFGLVRAFATTTVPDVVAMSVCVADVVLYFFFAARVRRGSAPDVVDDTAKIRQLYLSSWWIWVDVLAAVPLRFAFLFGGDANYEPDYDAKGQLIMGRTGCAWCKTEDELRYAVEAAKWLAHIRILKYLRHLTYFHRSGHCPVTKFYIVTQFVVGRALLTLSRFLCLVHICAVGYLALPLSSSYSSGGQIIENSRPHYAQGVFIVLYCFSTVGYGSIEASSDGLMYYFIMLVLVGAVVNGYVVASVVEFLSRSDVESEKKKKIAEADALLKYFCVPAVLGNELLQYQNHLLSYDLVRAYDQVVGTLPEDFRQKLNLYSRARAIRSVPFFADVHSSAKLELCEGLLQLVFVPDESLISVGDEGEEMFIVNHGFADVIDASGEYVMSYRTGCYFGELALMARRAIQRIAEVRALTYCDVFVLTRPAFLHVVRRYPRLRQRVRELLPELQARHSKMSLDVIDFDLSHLDEDDADGAEDDDDETKARELLGRSGDAVEAIINAEWLSRPVRSMVKQKVKNQAGRKSRTAAEVESGPDYDCGVGDAANESIESIVAALAEANAQVTALVDELTASLPRE